jgi:hypothetical protein
MNVDNTRWMEGIGIPREIIHTILYYLIKGLLLHWIFLENCTD